MIGRGGVMKLAFMINDPIGLRKSLLVLTTVAIALYCPYGLSAGRILPDSQPNLCFDNQQSNSQQPAPTAEQSPAHKYFTDVVLIDQNGQKLRFYTDLLQGKVVIINSFFATCQGSCLPMNRNLEKVQQALGGRLGKDVHIISISVDPTVDTPPRLKEYAKKLNAREGWYFLTGDEQNVELALTKLGQFVSEKQDHLNIFIIGNERTGLWKKAFGLAPSDQLVKVVESVLNDKPSGDK
jgi:protein SCO1